MDSMVWAARKDLTIILSRILRLPRIGYTSQWDSPTRSICAEFSREVTTGESSSGADAEQQLKNILIDQLQRISNSE